MRAAIIVTDPFDWTAQALYSSFTKKGMEAIFLNFSELFAAVNGRQSFRSSGVDLLDLDVLLVRDLGKSGTSDVAFRFEALQALQQSGIPVVNPPQAIARAANKFATSLALQNAGVNTPKTAATTSLQEAKTALQDFKKAVSKPLFGFKGNGIVLL
jgi:tetrahydromethanopterin:alpha-L-glutamate ligase